MILSPGILALIAVCVLVAVYALYAAGTGLGLVARWEAGSPAADQLWRERRTCLLSAMLGMILLADLLCVGVFVAVADRLHGFFTGAMCALGTLRANPYGLPTAWLMLTGVVLCGIWLPVNRLDAGAPDARVVRLKYLGLVPVALVLAAQAVLLVAFFAGLQPGLITSCCATYFGDGGSGMAADVAHLPPAVMRPLFWGMLAAAGAAGLLSGRAGFWRDVHGVLSAAMLPVGLAAVLSFLSVAVYELPTHHCPFCLLQLEYGGVGYLLYAGLLLATVPGMAAGAVRWCGRYAATGTRSVQVSARLQRWSLAGYGLLAVTAGWLESPDGAAVESAGLAANSMLLKGCL